MSNKRFYWETRPIANKNNIVSGKNYRFTVLTAGLIRCEYSENGVFEDRASQYVFYRDFPETDYTKTEENGILTIETERVVFTYNTNEKFSASSLSAKLKNEPATTWRYGEYAENLGGTTKTLDGINGAFPLEDGVCARCGYAVLDDSHTLVLNDEGWVEVRNKNTEDFYFFGYGYDYLDAVKDYYRLTGVPPMLPAYALGNWWSRYHKYTQQEYIDLMEKFKAKNIPFSVSVVDMDWHITEIPEDQRDEYKAFHNGWTGYTWNEKLFPDYKAFLNYLHENNLKTALNLHPAAGVCPHEVQYKQMAEMFGIDPASHKRVPFDILNPKFMEAYFDVLHHPYEEDGVDFWWMDWQQGTTYWWIHEENKNGHLKDEREILDPLWMLNHLHILDIKRNGKRPMFFSRFSGPGSQRYPVGFSGDTYVTWDSLNFQPYFTLTASNIGYSWWSHDIGGHMCGYRDEELTVRWIQLGVFSPINRLHSTDNNFVRKEPWCCNEQNERIISDWLRLRHRLFPYIYTMNYRNHHDLEPLVQPMYYSYPKCSAAYECKNQFMFGSELMVAPITEKNSVLDKLGGTKAFLPKGDWFDFFSGLHYYSKNGRVMDIYRTIDSYPVFAKAGAIVPMQELKPNTNELLGSDKMEIIVFPGADNEFNLYEDSGDYDNFEKGEFVNTKLTLQYGDKAVFTVNGSEGDLSLIPGKRSWKICFRGFSDKCSAAVYVNGAPVDAAADYNKDTRTLEVTYETEVTNTVRIELTGEALMTDNSDVVERCFNLLQRCEISTARKDYIYYQVSKVDVANRWTVQGIGVNSPEEQHLVNAVREQLTLVEELYESY